VLGIWANSASEFIIGAPSFYAVSSSADLEALATEDELRRLQIGPQNLVLMYLGRGGPNDPDADLFRQAFLRLKAEAGLYSDGTGVDFIGDTIFRTSIRIPANVPVGRYTATVILFADGSPLTRAEAGIDISKTGFEQYMFTLSRQESLAYGLAVVVLALLIGWLAGVIFRRD
jgi:uncharacterized protein (TIGR02186 family)